MKTYFSMTWESTAWTTTHLESTAIQSAHNAEIQLYFKGTSCFGSSMSHFWFETDGRILIWKTPQTSQCPWANRHCSDNMSLPTVIPHRLGVHGPTTALHPPVSVRSSEATLSLISNQKIIWGKKKNKTKTTHVSCSGILCSVLHTLWLELKQNFH